MKKILFFLIASIVVMFVIGGCDKQKTYEVVFDANGGTGTMQSQTLTEGESQSLDDNSFSNEGRVFGGWNTLPDGSGISYTAGQLITLSSDITLYAQWTSEEEESETSDTTPEPEPVIVTVTFDANGGSGEMAPQEFTSNEAQLLVANAFTYDDHIFLGWNTAADGTETAYTNTQEIIISTDITLYAQWMAFSGNVGIHNYVDMGLPSGMKWATCNIGATSPEDYGDYFAWGETKPKNTYSWSNYRYSNGGLFTLTKYCNNPANGYNGYTDNLTTLEACDDAATANWGESWRMPTYRELQELVDVCTSEWVILNGVRGRMFTGPNGNSIFLPATHWYNFGYEETNYGGEYDYGGCYWSSSLVLPEAHDGLFLSIHSERCEDCFNNGVFRYMGLFVRAVCQ